MKIILVKEKTIREYASIQPRSASSFTHWIKKLNESRWNTPMDILETYIHTDLLGTGSSRVVFDIGGNNYRMICKYFFGKKSAWLYICWIGTHAEYDKLCSKNNQYTVWTF